MRAVGWAPRALLSAATAPVGVALGLGAAVLAAVLERPGLAVVGVLLAGAPALYFGARAAVLDRELRARQPTAAQGGAAPAERDPAPVEIDVRTPTEHLVVPPAGTPLGGRTDTRIDTGELQRIWDLDEAPTAPASRGVPAGRPRVGTAEARVYDALAHADADVLTRLLEGPGRRGRHVAEAVDDAPPRTGTSAAAGTYRDRSVRGRHAA